MYSDAHVNNKISMLFCDIYFACFWLDINYVVNIHVIRN